MPPGRLRQLSIRICSFIFLVILAQFLPISNGLAAISKSVIVGDSIPELLQTGSELIFTNSDSLLLNGRLLNRNIDYTYDKIKRGFDLSNLKFSSTDTLAVSYRIAPGWLAKSFGQPIPEISSYSTRNSSAPPPSVVPQRLQQSALSEINISGAKTFRVTTQSAGTSDFGQSLDLNIEGKLTEDLKVSGAISDRGFNPSYGTSNSRLEELDKVNLKIESDNFNAQIGDILLGQRLYQHTAIEKNISGASVNVNAGNLNFNGVAARPKGRFASAAITGIDGVQGPYQVGDNGQARAVVPNSEEVWLDGNRLQRGADNDYTMDYPTGRITFTVKYLIDRRSRIEMDFEPVSTEYETELFSAGSGYQVGDTTFFAAVEWYREGDVSGQSKIGEFSSADKTLLESAGDNDSLAFRSGARADSAGNYIINPDSLPDTLFQYVGSSNGTQSVTFSFVGTGKGDYKFAGGDEYYYVGTGSGDYLPIVRLPLPKRVEYYVSKFSVNNVIVGNMQAEVNFSQFDRNLVSSLDDDDNRGMLLNFNSRREFKLNDHTNKLGVRVRLKEAEFEFRSRINTADFNRQYLKPWNTIFHTDERLIEANCELTPTNNLKINPLFGKLDYQNRFSSDRKGVGAVYGSSDKFNAGILWSETSANLTDSFTGAGLATIWRGNLSIPLVKSVKLTNLFEHDRRQYDYYGNNQGLRYNLYSTTIENVHEKITYELYIEDSLESGWSESLNRNRISGSSIRRIGHFNYSTYLGYQWLNRPDRNEQSFLGRTNLQYHNSRKQISINSGYTLSEETRHARGITYLEVEPGQGNYIYENGRYIPDLNGNFIQVEEILSDQSRVSRAEKSFQFSKNWRFAQVRFNSDLREELLEDGRREVWWIVPFLSDQNQPYLIYNRNFNGDLLFAPIKGGHAVNISLDERIEIRRLAGAPQFRRDRTGTLRLKQVIDDYYLEQQLKLFTSDRDQYFIGAGEINGYKIGSSVKRPVKSSEYSIGFAFRRAESKLNEISKTFSIESNSRIRLIDKGDLRASVELYSQLLQNTIGFPSYQLTDNKPGARGAVWSTGFNYNVRQGMRINFNLSGRHSNETTARLFGRTEIVAEF